LWKTRAFKEFGMANIWYKVITTNLYWKQTRGCT